MTARTVSGNYPREERWTYKRLPLGAGVKALRGAAAVFDTATEANQGYVIPGVATATEKFLGFFEEDVDNTSGAAGAKLVNVYFGKEVVLFWWANDGTISQVNIGSPAYLLDSGPTASLVGTGHTLLGTIFAVDAVKGVLVER